MNVNTNNKTVLKILSGLVAVVLWFAITYTEDPIISQSLGDITIEYEGEKRLMDNGLIIVNKDEIPDISVVIRGKRSSVISAIGSVVASCDVSGIETSGENTVEVKYIYPTSSITMAKTKTKEITVETQKLITRNIPIRISQKNADKNSECIVKSVSDADTIRIKGAENDVYLVSYALVEIDVSSMEAGNNQEYFYRLCDKDGNTLSENNIIYKSSDTVGVDNFVYKKTTLPVKVQLSEKLEDSNSLTVKNISADKIDVGIMAETVPEALYATISSLSEGTEYKLDIEVPDGIYVPEEDSKITATCEITPLVEEDLELTVELLNNQDKKLAVKPEKIKAKIKYPQGMDVSGKIKATVDLKNVKEGDEIPVKIEKPDKVICQQEHTVEAYIK